MRVLQIDESTVKDINKALDYADRHHIDVVATMEGRADPAGDNPDYVTYIHDGFRVVYSIEYQPKASCLCKHLSVSVEGKKLPAPIAVERILEAFKMKSLSDSISVWIEEEVGAVNVLQEA